MGWIKNFYKGIKKPWLSFLLVIIIGPFGFLYYSWKLALLLFIAGPFWFIQLKNTRFNLDRPVPHYTVLLLLAIFAWLDTKTHNRKVLGKQTIETAKNLLPTEYDRIAFTKFIAARKDLSRKVQQNPFISSDPQGPWARWTLSQLFANYGGVLGNAGDLAGASMSFAFSMDFFSENPVAWSGMAELNVAREDLIAARYAMKVLDFDPLHARSELVTKVFSDPQMIGALHEMHGRMAEIIRICVEQWDWKDSYPQERSHRPFDDPE